MRPIIAATLGALAGLVIGGMPARKALLEAEAKLAEAEGDCEDRQQRAAMRDNFTSLLGAAASSRSPDQAPPERSDADEEADREGDEEREERDALRREMREDLEEDLSNSSEMAAAKTALELRRSQSWASLREDGDLSESQLSSMETAVDQMNQELDALANELVTLMEQDELPGRRDMMGWSADVLDVMIEADDALYHSLDAEQRESVDEGALDPFSYVDPDLMDTFAQMTAESE